MTTFIKCMFSCDSGPIWAIPSLAEDPMNTESELLRLLLTSLLLISGPEMSLLTP